MSRTGASWFAWSLAGFFAASLSNTDYLLAWSLELSALLLELLLLRSDRLLMSLLLSMNCLLLLPGAYPGTVPSVIASTSSWFFFSRACCLALTRMALSNSYCRVCLLTFFGFTGGFSVGSSALGFGLLKFSSLLKSTGRGGFWGASWMLFSSSCYLRRALPELTFSISWIAAMFFWIRSIRFCACAAYPASDLL